MSSEAQVTSYLQIIKDNLEYQSRPASFQADVSIGKGPTPGALTVTTPGVDVDLSELTQPGLCRIANIDSTNRVEVGVWDPETTTFYPMLELLPGETYIVRLSRNIQGEYVGTGTVEGAATNTLRIKAVSSSCIVLVEAFDS